MTAKKERYAKVLTTKGSGAVIPEEKRTPIRKGPSPDKRLTRKQELFVRELGQRMVRSQCGRPLSMRGTHPSLHTSELRS